MIADADDAHTPASTPVSELQIPKKNANDAGQSEGSTNAFPRPDLQMQMMQEETMSAPSGATADENIWCMATLGPTRAAKLMVHPPTILSMIIQRSWLLFLVFSATSVSFQNMSFRRTGLFRGEVVFRGKGCSGERVVPGRGRRARTVGEACYQMGVVNPAI